MYSVKGTKQFIGNLLFDECVNVAGEETVGFCTPFLIVPGLNPSCKHYYWFKKNNLIDVDDCVSKFECLVQLHMGVAADPLAVNVFV